METFHFGVRPKEQIVSIKKPTERTVPYVYKEAPVLISGNIPTGTHNKPQPTSPPVIIPHATFGGVIGGVAIACQSIPPAIPTVFPSHLPEQNTSHSLWINEASLQ